MSFYTVQNWPNGNETYQRFDIAIVIGTYNRAHLLLRSLYHYQLYAGASSCLVVLDDGSTDNTRELCKKWANPDLPIFYFKLEDKQPGEWRDSAIFINKGISFAIHALGARFIFPTHPEICVGETTIAESVQHLKENKKDFVLAGGYYLNPKQQESFGFKHHVIGIESIQTFIAKTPDFYTTDDPTHAYHPAQTEKYGGYGMPWKSWIFGGATAGTWKWFKGLPASMVWGSVDVAFMHQRDKWGFRTWTPEKKTSMVVHQNHDDPNVNVPTPRLEKPWRDDISENHTYELEEKPDWVSVEYWKNKP